ncbi:MAG: hypothetical protein ABI683_12585 [Ginsengibacter sp.]
MIQEEDKERVVLCRLVFGFILLCLLFRFFLNATPSHLLQPSLFNLNLDLTYWLYQYFSIPQLVVYSHTGAIAFDVLLFGFCIMAILFPSKRIIIIFFSFLFLIYAITYNTYIVHHAHPLTILTLITIPFWFKKFKNWKLMWEGMRYYVCYIYAMSFIWKAVIGNSFFYWNQGIGSVKFNLAEYMYHYPGTVMASLYAFFIAHPYLLNIGNTFIFLLEGLMIVGFFTKKYDRILMILPVIIHLSTYIFADVFFIEMLVLVFVFFRKKDTELIGRRLPFILN